MNSGKGQFMKKAVYISVVVPVYNEEHNIEAFYERVSRTLTAAGASYEIIFVLDPCTDMTEQKVYELIDRDKGVKLIRTSRRFGQPACTMAGIERCGGEACFVIDADMQDPPELMTEMLKKWEEGYKVVYAKRGSREGETLFKRLISFIGYLIIERISDNAIPRNTGDFRLLDREVVNQIKTFKEHDAFLRGIVSYVGFKQTFVEYNRDARASGSGKYNKFTGSLRIGLNGIFNFSKTPLNVIIYLGALIFVLGFSALLFIGQLLNAFGAAGALLLIVILFLTGIQLICLGILAQYFARIFDEIKGRPGIIIEKMVGFGGPQEKDRNRGEA